MGQFVLIPTLVLFLATASAIALQVPVTSQGDPGPGKRVRQKLPQYENNLVHHMLYLPPTWKQGEKYSVVMEYPPNKYKEFKGEPEDTQLGYGLTSGEAIWISLPFVDATKRNSVWGFGDIGATIQYCKDMVKIVINEYGGDPDNLFLTGFSRGAVAVNAIGLADEEIAKLWRGFFAHSLYDGISLTSKDSAASRLTRLNNRPQFISDESPSRLDAVKDFLQQEAPNGTFTYQQMGGAHTDSWVLTNNEARQNLHAWYQSVLTLSSAPTTTPTFSSLPPTVVPSTSLLPSASRIPSAEPSLSNLPSQARSIAPSTSGPVHKVYFGDGQACNSARDGYDCPIWANLIPGSRGDPGFSDCSSGTNIIGTDSNYAYSCHIWKPFSYKLELTPGKRYAVRLGFAETYSGTFSNVVPDASGVVFVTLTAGYRQEPFLSVLEVVEAGVDPPTDPPSRGPSNEPTELASGSPSADSSLSSLPTSVPSPSSSVPPSNLGSHIPSNVPSKAASRIPSAEPSSFPTVVPSTSLLPSALLSQFPTNVPSNVASEAPSASSSVLPTSELSHSPSQLPSMQRSKVPSSEPSNVASEAPSAPPTILPSTMPSTSGPVHKVYFGDGEACNSARDGYDCPIWANLIPGSRGAPGYSGCNSGTNIIGTDSNYAYSCHIYMPFSYKLELTPGKRYAVRLGFAETYSRACGEGKRRFNVAVGDQIEEDVDISREVGCTTAYDLTFSNVEPDASGEVNVTLTAGYREQPYLSVLEVVMM